MTDQMSFGTIFTAVASAVDPAAPALIHDDRVTTWADFERRTTALAGAFVAAGMAPGDRVAHLMRNSPAYLETSVAGFKARGVHVNVNYRYTGEELFYILDNSGATVVVFDAEFAAIMGQLRPRLGVKLFLQVGGETNDFARDFDSVAEAGAALPVQTHAPDDMLFIYTGGTTGMPKGVMWDQGAIWSMLAASATVGLAAPASVEEHLDNVRAGIGRSRALILPPLMHGTGYLTALATLARGGCVVTLPGAGFVAEAAVRACAEHACDYAAIVGDAFARPMLRALDEGHGSIATLRTMLSSGTMWSPEVKAGLLAHAPDMVLIDALSSSEGLGMGVALQTRANAGGATRFAGDANTLVLDEEMRPIPAGSGRMGRIARGGLIPRGYWRDEAKSAATFVTVDGLRYSMPGDWAIPEADGTLTLLGRGNQCINTAGEKVFPEEVEEALKTHPAVEDALVFGVADERWGQVVTAVVEAPAHIDGAALQAHCRESLAAYKAPKRVVVVAKVPRGPNGKADYAAARTLAG